MKIPNRIILCLFLVIICAMPIQTIWNQRETFFSKGYGEQYKNFERAYHTSQYVQKEDPGIIPDETLESFAGGFFLKGNNPILIVHDQPPLGRYIIALSILLFDNQNTILIPLLFVAVTAIVLVGKKIYNNTLLALIPAGIFVNEPVFLNKLMYSPLLEPIQLPFIFLAIYFFINGIEKKKYLRWFVLTSVMLGFVISIRFFALGAGVLLAMIVYFLIEKKAQKKFIYFILSLPFALLILIASYSKTLQSGYSTIQIFGIQNYILDYHSSKFTLPFSLWDLLLFNRWHTWWGVGSILSDDQWLIIWPISVFLAFLFFLFALFKKITLSPAEKIIFLSVVSLCTMLSLGHTSTRYFLPILPMFYILAFSFVYKFLKKVYHEKIIK